MASAPGPSRPILKRALVRAANTLLTGLGALRLGSRAAADDAFEYWLWARTVAAARRSPPLTARLSGARAAGSRCALDLLA
jgi:hypothetical protein